VKPSSDRSLKVPLRSEPSPVLRQAEVEDDERREVVSSRAREGEWSQGAPSILLEVAPRTVDLDLGIGPSSSFPAPSRRPEKNRTRTLSRRSACGNLERASSPFPFDHFEPRIASTRV